MSRISQVAEESAALSARPFKAKGNPGAIPALLLFLLMVQGAWATPVKPSVDALCRKAFSEGEGKGGAVAVLVHGKVVHEQCYGQTDINQRTEVITPTTPFYLASVSKQFTATCVMMLAEQGKLHLDQDVRQYLPEFPQYNQGRPIRVDDLLTMRSGIKEYDTSEPHMDRKKLTAYYKSVGLDYPTGTHHEYNNGSYALLGYIVQQVSGQSLGAFMQKNIFGPLKMKHTQFDDSETADGGIYSCLEDMICWSEALRTKPLVSSDMLKLSWTRARFDNGQTFGYGFGWEVSSNGNQVYHSGVWTGASTYIAIDFTHEACIIVLSNIDHAAPPLAEAISELEE